MSAWVRFRGSARAEPRNSEANQDQGGDEGRVEEQIGNRAARIGIGHGAKLGVSDQQVIVEPGAEENQDQKAGDAYPPNSAMAKFPGGGEWTAGPEADEAEGEDEGSDDNGKLEKEGDGGAVAVEAGGRIRPAFGEPVEPVKNAMPIVCAAISQPAKEVPEDQRQRQHQKRQPAAMKHQRQGGQADKGEAFRPAHRRDSDEDGQQEEVTGLVGPEGEDDKGGEWKFRHLTKGVEEEKRLGKQADHGQRRPAIALVGGDAIADNGRDQGEKQRHAANADGGVIDGAEESGRQGIKGHAPGAAPDADEVADIVQDGAGVGEMSDSVAFDKTLRLPCAGEGEEGENENGQDGGQEVPPGGARGVEGRLSGEGDGHEVDYG